MPLRLDPPPTQPTPLTARARATLPRRPRLHPSAPQLPSQPNLVNTDPPTGPRRLQTHRQVLEARRRQERRQAVGSDLALRQRRMAVAVRAELGLRVVHVQALQPLQAD